MIHALLSRILASPTLRERVLFELRNQYYDELAVGAPIGSGLVCPIVSPEYWWSFEEIFFNDEYRPVFDLIPPPRRWLDIGSHAGFFSLFALALRRKRGLSDSVEALLIDGDSRVQKSVQRIASQNKLGEQFKFLHGAIAPGQGDVFFEEASVMSSSLAEQAKNAGVKRRVPIATAERILEALKGPYDLIKIDVEGAEHHFLTAYRPAIERTRFLLLEWHSWHSGGGGVEQIRADVKALGFEETLEVVGAHDVKGNHGQCGTLLFRRIAAA